MLLLNFHVEASFTGDRSLADPRMGIHLALLVCRVISQHAPLKQQASCHAKELTILFTDAEVQGGQCPS